MKHRFNRRLRPRQADIAKLAGVSQSTVSLVLGGSSAGQQLSPKTRERVLDAARRLGYAADPAARKLAGGRNLLVGLYTFEPAFPIDHHDFYYPFLVGVEEAAAAAGHDLLLFTSAGQDDTRTVFRGGANRLLMADGCILLGRNAPSEQLARLLEADFPFVFIGRRDLAGLSYVGADYDTATAAVVRHLHELGHRSLAYLGDLRPDTSATDRESGFVRAAAELDLEGRTLRDNRFSAGTLHSLMTAGTTGILCEAQQIPALTRAVADLRLVVPRDLSYCVLGDPIGDETAETRLATRFTIPRREMGAAAVRLLLEAIATWPDSRQAPERLLLPCHLVEGKTSGPMPLPA